MNYLVELKHESDKSDCFVIATDVSIIGALADATLVSMKNGISVTVVGRPREIAEKVEAVLARRLLVERRDPLRQGPAPSRDLKGDPPENWTV